jgi:hypothetical protein
LFEPSSPHNIVKQTGSTKLVRSFLSDNLRKGSVADFMSQTDDTLVLSEGAEELIFNGKIHAINSTHLISILVHFESQPNEFWAATNLDPCVSFNNSSLSCIDFLDSIHAPLTLYECYFSGIPNSQPKIRLIPYSKINNESVTPSGWANLRKNWNDTTGTDYQSEVHAEKLEWEDSRIPAFIIMCVFATLIIIAIVRMWPSSRRGYEPVP